MTPKQKLREHLGRMHGALPASLEHGTLTQLARWHAERHHRYANNHYHEGVNLGPGQRPEGWRTGEGAVPR